MNKGEEMKGWLALAILVLSGLTIAGCIPSSICGDGICSVDEKAINNCPQDCKPILPTCDDASLRDTLRDGETKTYASNGKDYEITAVFIDSTQESAKLSVNGFLTRKLYIGEGQKLDDGKSIITIMEVLTNAREGIVEFCFKAAPAAEPDCGNGIVENGEECEGEGTVTECLNKLGLPSTKECNECTWSSCGKYEGFCGDGKWVSIAEICEGENLGNLDSCTNIAEFTGGTLTCNAQCRYDTSNCTPDYMCSCTMRRALVEFNLSIAGTNNYITDSLDVGEAKKYTVRGNDYEIIAEFFSASQTTKLRVNGILSGELGEGDSFDFGNNVTLKIDEILTACSMPMTHSMVQFNLSSDSGSILDRLRDGENKTYALVVPEYEVKAVFISDEHTAKLSINGFLTKELAEGDSYTLPNREIITVTNIMVASGSSIIDFFVANPKTGKIFNEKLAGGETKIRTILGRDYEFTAVYVNGPVNSSVIISVNGQLTQELSAGQTDILSSDVLVGVYNVEVCGS